MEGGYDFFFFLATFVAFGMAWAIGAQDVANALGTSVGSNALSVKQAILVGSICEFLGSLAGEGVATTISEGIVSPASMDSILYIQIMFCALAGTLLWLIVATYFKLPVSTSHSLIGSILSLLLVLGLANQIRGMIVFHVMLSWITSPIFGGLISYLIFSWTNDSVLCSRHPLPAFAALQQLPLLWGSTIGILVLFLFQVGPFFLRLSILPAITCAMIVMMLILFFGDMYVQKRHEKKSAELNEIELNIMKKEDSENCIIVVPNKGDDNIGRSADHTDSSSEGEGGIDGDMTDSRTPLNSTKTTSQTIDLKQSIDEAENYFRPLMVLTACVVSFAHGSNDVSNAIGPYAAIYAAYQGKDVEERESGVPFIILMAGGVGIVLGLATYGYRLMFTVGKNITKLTYSRGFAAQIGTAISVLTATLLGLSVSTTHCLIGSIAGVALVHGKKHINMNMMKTIGLSWIVTMPAAGFSSILIFFLSFSIHRSPNGE